jgi:hypothetical protein
MGKWLIAEWRDAWRFTSLWVGALVIGALSVWNVMPPAVRDLVPDRIELGIGALLWIVLIVARIARQPWSQAAIDAKRAAQQADDYSDWEGRAHG